MTNQLYILSVSLSLSDSYCNNKWSCATKFEISNEIDELLLIVAAITILSSEINLKKVTFVIYVSNTQVNSRRIVRSRD